MTKDDVAVLHRHLERERRARKAAEQFLEEKSYQLYQANLALRKAASELEERVEARTIELITANAKLQDEIAERMRIEQELAHARDIALQASRLKSEFLATMSHEIRTPMNGIIGMTEILLETTLDQEQQEYLSIAHEESYKLLEIINTILDFSKIEAGKIILEEVEFDLVDEIWGVLRLFTPKADAKEISLRYASTSNIPATIIGDALRLRQILTNLIGNAVKFTAKGEVKLSVNRHPQAQCILPHRVDCAEIEFVIEDSGIGMAPALLEDLFTPFTQADSSTTRRYGGTGLGLAITKRLVDLIGGKLQVNSDPQVGSKFTVTLPYRLKSTVSSTHNRIMREKAVSVAEVPSVTDDHRIPSSVAPYARRQTQQSLKNGVVPTNQLPKSNGPSKAHGAAVPPRTTTEPKPILLVEDYPNNQAVALAHLKKLGYSADVAENGQIAIDKIIAHGEQYRLVFMDWQMPLLDGLETTRLIRKMEEDSGQHLPIIGMTANAIKGDRERCLEAGMDDYIAKPFQRSDLRRLLDRWLR